MSKPHKQLYEFGPFRLDPMERMLLKEGVPVALLPKAFDTLLVLVEHRGHLLKKDELLKAVWRDVVVEEANLAQTISLLRKALGESPSEPHYIETIPKRGYRFVASVREVGDATEGLPIGESRLASEQERPIEEKEVTPAGAVAVRLKNKAAVVAGTAFAVVLLGLVSVGLLLRSAGSGGVQSLAVLPLENLSHDPEQEYFADGMTDQLITELSKIEALRVISRSSVMQYKRARKPLSEIARELNVEAVVEGTVLRAGNRVRITAQLIQANTESHLWANSYEGDLSDILTLQSGVAQAIAGAIRINLTPEDRARLANTRAVNPEAQEAYLRGRYHHSKGTARAWSSAVEYFTHAIALDPSYAHAYAWLADTYHLLGVDGVVPPWQMFPKAEAAALKAIEIDPTLSTAHAALGWVEMSYEWNWSNAEKAFERAIELNAHDARAHETYARYLASMGRFEEALRAIKRAQVLVRFRST